MTTAILVSEVRQCIYFIRGNHVILDRDLAKFYQVETKILNKTVRRNSERFPEDFVFQLNQPEYDTLSPQSITSEIGRGRHRKYIPMVFTEQGSAMVSSILQSDRAIAVHIAITRAFVQCRQSIGNYQVLLEEIRAIKGRLDQIDLRNTQQSQIFLEALQKQKPRSPAVTQKQVNYKTRGVVLDKNEVHKVEAIQQAVAKYYKLEPQDLKITSRKRTIALPRQIAIYLIRKHTEIGFSEIGRLFDGKDHTTILHAYRKIDHDFREVASIQKAIQSIQNSLT